MDCHGAGWPTNREFLRQWMLRSELEHVPLSGTIELTRRCNLRCVHCYIGDQDVQRALRQSELSTAEWLSIVDQAAAAGCLFLLITGGDPLLRPDFSTVYRRAKELGLVVTVFTNGTMVTDDLLALFHELPPHLVEVSLYGASAAVYEGITGIPGSYGRCLAGIERLLGAGVHLGLKTVLLSRNQAELAAMETMARAYGVKFRFDPAISACLDGRGAPMDLRVSPEDAVGAEFADPRRRQNWLSFQARHGRIPRIESLYVCGAGLTVFHVDPFGKLQMCLMASEPGYNLRTGSFAEGWYEKVPPARSRKASPGNECLDCEGREFCGYCPGFFAMESGSEERRSEYLCEMGRLRLERIRQLL